MNGTEHYENFPVASWLCPPKLRQPVIALYRFARTADDLADEGRATAQERLEALQHYRNCLNRALQGNTSPDMRWSDVFIPLSRAIQQHLLPTGPLHALLDAFEQDVRYTATGRWYSDEAELLDYCTRSANPVGRLLLHLYGMDDPESLRQSDAICSALQLINFWQDLSVDLPRQRHYLPMSLLRQHQISPEILLTQPVSQITLLPRAQAMITVLVRQARELMLIGTPLALRLPGRMGWELRLVVQGGLRIAEKTDRLGANIWHERPRLHASDMPRLLWRAYRMG